MKNSDSPITKLKQTLAETMTDNLKRRNSVKLLAIKQGHSCGMQDRLLNILQDRTKPQHIQYDPVYRPMDILRKTEEPDTNSAI